jgi:REP element-mobilizing transposase RayT
VSRGEGTAGGGQPPSAVPPAKPAQHVYKRNLPHYQRPSTTYFFTFATKNRRALPEDARGLVLASCIHDHGRSYVLHAAVVMPDHVHLLLTPLVDHEGNTYGLAQIMSGIKGASAHTVNRALRRSGSLWQAESFDRLVRSDESLREKAEYICANPVRAGLVDTEDEYPWLWREWIEGAASVTKT